MKKPSIALSAENIRFTNYLDGLIHWMQFDLGKATGIFRLIHCEKLTGALSQYNQGHGRFYFMEDILFIAFPKKMVCLMMGNDE